LRWLAILFVLLIVALQYPMWLGKGGWLQVRELGRLVNRQHEANGELKARNDALDADVRDLKTGFEGIEERARSELGMIRPDEIFFQIQSDPAVRAKDDAPPAPLKNESATQPPTNETAPALLKSETAPTPATPPR
jgi:cell division protein FtsB